MIFNQYENCSTAVTILWQMEGNPNLRAPSLPAIVPWRVAARSVDLENQCNK